MSPSGARQPRAIAGDPGFVLAGGASRRMGRDKALLPLDGVPLAARLAEVLRAGGCDPVGIVGRRPELRTLGLPVLFEPGFGEATAEERVHHPLLGVVVHWLSRRTWPISGSWPKS